MPHPLGVEDLRTLDDVVDAVVEMRAARPTMDSAIVKLNEGVSGRGQRPRRPAGLPAPGSPDERAAVVERVRAWSSESPTTPFDVYVAKFAEGGGIVEERIVGDELRSPSVQLRVLPGGDVELLSTHDQLLGGASGQSYLGCAFPADPEYARAITQHAATIGERLAELGVLGRFAVDFVVVRETQGEWTPYAIELNLRKGGTTHPFLTLQFLTDGRYDPTTALFLTPRGHEKHLVATDHLESELLRGLAPSDLFDIVARHGLHFDQSRQVGVVFHMISCLTEHGRVGLTAVGDTPARRTGATATPSGSCWRRPGSALEEVAAAGLRGHAAGLVRRLRLQPRDGPVPVLPGRRPPGRRYREYPGCRDPRPRRQRRPRGDRRARLRRRVRSLGRGHGVLRPHGTRRRRLPGLPGHDPSSSPTSRPRRCGVQPGGEFARDLAGCCPTSSRW